MSVVLGCIQSNLNRIYMKGFNALFSRLTTFDRNAISTSAKKILREAPGRTYFSLSALEHAILKRYCDEKMLFPFLAIPII